MSTPTLLTPKELADAIGASESSLRRWVDSGEIRMSRTAGGHRRIPLAEAIQFIRKMGAPVIRPDLLGLGDVASGAGSSGEADDQRLFQALAAGKRDMVRAMIMSWYLEGRSLPALFDGPVRAALYRLGELWKHDERGILIEHQATAICVESIAAIRSLLPAPEEHAPLALGGSPEGDPYQLPTMMAGVVLSDAGFREVNFGANTPVELLASEAMKRGAGLMWLSISAPLDFKATRKAIRRLAGVLLKQQIPLVLGGRYHAECAPRGQENLHLIGSMSELAAFARGIRSVAASAAPPAKKPPRRQLIHPAPRSRCRAADRGPGA